MMSINDPHVCHVLRCQITESPQCFISPWQLVHLEIQVKPSLAPCTNVEAGRRPVVHGKGHFEFNPGVDQYTLREANMMMTTIKGH